VPLPTLPDTKEDVKFYVRPNTQDRRPVSESLGCHIKGIAPPHADHDDSITMAAGVCKRFGNKPTEMEPALLDELRQFTRDTLSRWERKYGLKRLKSKDYPVLQWIEDINASQSRKSQLREASELIYDVKKHTLVSLFIKDEFYENVKYPRLINSRHDVFKCRVGPMFRRIEKKLFKLPMFIKRVPVHKRMEYISERLYEPGGVYYNTDFEAFETIFTKDVMLNVEFELYKFMAPFDREGAQFLQDIEVLLGQNVCKNPILLVWIIATRMSGENNTSLGNSFANYIFNKFAAFKAGVKTKGVVEGDDGTFRASGEIPQEIYQRMGLKIQREEFAALGDMSFCGLLQDEDGRQNITNPIKVLAKFGWCSRKYVGSSDKTKRSLAVAKALSYLHQYPHMPLVRPWCDMILRTCEMNNYRIMKYINSLDEFARNMHLSAFNSYRKDNIPSYKPSTGTRCMVDRLFGISIKQQLDIEDKLKSCDYGPIEMDVEFGDVYHYIWTTFVSQTDTLNSVVTNRQNLDEVTTRISHHLRRGGARPAD